mmetsp:Transcript_15604/g.28351  ORF Transcript_15604/g.28351 Transcript_15604/m.28351 type:complete len:88 (-) Transcript_15604:188-451(-)
MVRYNLAKGHPNASLVPIQEMQEVLHSVSQIQEKEVGSCLNYGPNSGDVGFKREIASTDELLASKLVNLICSSRTVSAMVWIYCVGP